MARISRLRASCGSFERTLPLLDGQVSGSGGITLDFVADPFPATGLLDDYQARRNLLMTEERAFDVCEMGLAPLVAARSRGIDLLAIPVFHYRRFRHSAIVCRTAANIKKPEDLIGKRLGLRRFSLSAGIWARGLLQHEYGIPLDRVHWVVQVEAALRPEVASKLHVTLTPPEPPLEQLLLAGELDAMIEAFTIAPMRAGSSEVHSLFEEPSAVEIQYFRRTGIFPIMHTIVLWRSLVERDPSLAVSLHRAFVEAKTIAAAGIRCPTRYVLAEEEREWIDNLSAADRRLFFGDPAAPNDPWSYSLVKDRKTVETFLQYAFEQGVMHRRFEVEDLFAPGTIDL